MSSSSALSQSEILSIEHACGRLVLDFAHLNDRREYETLCALFEENGSFARPSDPDKVIEGRENILEAFQSRPGGQITRHIVSNIRITVESPNRARGTSYILLFTGKLDDQPEGNLGITANARQLVGEFEDEFVRTADGWRFSARRGRVVLHT